MNKFVIPIFVLCAGFSLQDEKPKQPKDQTEFIESTSPLKPLELFHTPYGANRITSDDMKNRLSRTLPEALKETPGVSVQKTGHGQGSPFIRGFTGFRNLMLIDGIRLNNSTFREGPNQYWNTVDSLILDRMEILKGPASVLYGSDSIGGTLSTFTKEPKSFEKGFHYNFNNFARYSSAEDSITERAEFFGNYDNLGFFSGITWRNYDDLSVAKLGRLDNTGYDDLSADLKFVYKLVGKSKLVFAYQTTDQDDAPRTHRTIFSKSWHGTTVGTDKKHDFDQKRDLLYLQYRSEEIQNMFYNELSVSLSLHRQGERLDRITSSNKTQVRKFTVNTPGFWFKLGSQTSLGYLTYGFEYYRDDVQSSGFDITSSGVITSFDRGEVADDSTYSLMGIYVQDEISPVKNLALTCGLRYNIATVDANEVDPAGFGAAPLNPFDDRFSALVGNLRAIYSINDNFNLIGGISQGFRSPGLDDLTAVKLVMSGQTDFPSPNLDSEKTITYEIGLRAKYPAKFNGSAFLFWTDLDDLIRRVAAPDISPTAFRKDNFAKGFMKGFEIEGKYNIDSSLAIFSDFAWVIGKADALIGTTTEEKSLAKVNPTMAHIGVSYQIIPDVQWAEFIITTVKEQKKLAPEEDGTIANDFQRIPPSGTPGYTTYSLRMNRELTKNVFVNMAVENITNKAYRVHGSGQNETGTNFLLGISSKF